MPLTRQPMTLFGTDGATPNFARFGSQAVNAPFFTKDIVDIQSLAAFKAGLQGALLPGQQAPFLEDLNALFYYLSYGINYLHQDGIPEWEPNTIYRTGSICRKAGTFELYGSLQDANLNQALPNKANNSFWQYLNPPAAPAGQVSATIAAVAPFGYLMMDGSTYAKAAYPDLYAIGGACITDVDANNFKLIDLRGRTLIGAGQGAGLTLRALGAIVGAETHAHTMAHQHKTTILRRSSDGSLIVKQTGMFGEADVVVDATGGAGFGAGAAPNPNKAHLTDNPEGNPNTGSASSMQPSAALNWIVKY